MKVASSWTSEVGFECNRQDRQDGSSLIKLSKSGVLNKPDEDTPCSLTVEFGFTCQLEAIEVLTSARHAEVYVGVINAKKEVELKYFETIRGVRNANDKNLYNVVTNFPSNQLFQSAVALSLKFLSIQPPQSKNVLRLETFEVHLRENSEQNSAVKTEAPAPTPMPSLTMVLQIQNAMQAQLEQKIYAAIDVKLNQLVQRLQVSESLVQKLASQMETNQGSHDTQALANVVDRLKALEKDVGALKESRFTELAPTE
ncbi:hypothetical protein THRCLA_02658 [Thraustotheca clavata]|uniref:Uncharacterized protein n=1 Tax=Thraustotheca clavata TaxID=74557 RepID=A0A1W0A4K8_9STRA|nr:hypothetical protein THRCLA_02658 [Thraustotheca clavata]